VIVAIFQDKRKPRTAAKAHPRSFWRRSVEFSSVEKEAQGAASKDSKPTGQLEPSEPRRQAPDAYGPLSAGCKQLN
jgi:hypothetical protein